MDNLGNPYDITLVLYFNVIILSRLEEAEMFMLVALLRHIYSRVWEINPVEIQGLLISVKFVTIQ